MIICPSILEKTAENYLKIIKKLLPYFNYFQIDIADGIYVNNKTEMINNLINSLIIHQSLINKISFDFHLMTKDYKNDIKTILQYKDKIKIKNIFIHYDLSPDYSFINANNNYLFNIGLVINPQDKINDLASKYDLKSIKSLQIMSVNPGKQGNPFIKYTIKKIEQLRLHNYRNKIFLDGGINNKTISFILNQKFLPDVICPGSFLAKANINQLEKRIDYLKNIL